VIFSKRVAPLFRPVNRAGELRYHRTNRQHTKKLPEKEKKDKREKKLGGRREERGVGRECEVWRVKGEVGRRGGRKRRREG
jgi:hypothetical protein